MHRTTKTIRKSMMFQIVNEKSLHTSMLDEL